MAKNYVIRYEEAAEGDLRVFYDVDERSAEVIVRAIRRKGRKTTQETL